MPGVHTNKHTPNIDSIMRLYSKRRVIMSEPLKLSKVFGLKSKEHTNDCLIYQPTSSSFDCMCGANAYNSCLNQIDQLSPDVEELKKILHDNFDSFFHQVHFYIEIEDWYNKGIEKSAQEIINKMSVWIKKGN